MRPKKHKSLTAILPLFLLTSLAPFAGAQPATGDGPDHGTPLEQMEILIAAFAKASAPDAMEEMLQRNPFFDKLSVGKGVAAVRHVADSVRLYLDHELIAAENLTRRYQALTYVLHFERQPILLQVRFYNPAGKTWVVHSWNFSANVDELIDAVREAKRESGK